MSVKQILKCNCGQRIVTRDVMQTGYYLRIFGPSFIYVKYRCSRCKKLGERFVKQRDWEDGILNDIAPELSDAEKEHLRSRGPISVHEQIRFHFELEKDGAVSKLVEQTRISTPRGSEDER
jgi:hypothetical protein